MNLVYTTLINYATLKPSVIGQIDTETNKRKAQHVIFLLNAELGSNPKLKSIWQNNQPVIFKSVKDMKEQESVPS